jgi:hypothetical protein
MRDMTLFLFSFSVPSSHSGYAIYLLVTRIMYSFTVPVENAVFKSVLALIVERYLEVQKNSIESRILFTYSVHVGGRACDCFMYTLAVSFSVLPGNAIYLRQVKTPIIDRGLCLKSPTQPPWCAQSPRSYSWLSCPVFFFKGTWVPLTGLTIVRQEDGLFGHPPVIIMISHPDPPLPRRPEAL